MANSPSHSDAANGRHERRALARTRLKRQRILAGPVGRVLFTLSWPMSLGLFSVIAFNVIDTLYIGQLGPGPLAAMGFCFPVIFSLSAVAIGMGNGATSVVARALGRGDNERAKALIANTVLFVVGSSVMLTLTMFLIGDAVFSLLGVPDALRVHVNSYMHVWYLGLPFLIMPIVLNGMIRATGEALTPSILMVVAAAINAAASPLLVFGLFGFPEMGMAGAAWATILARLVIAVLCVRYLLRARLIALSPAAFSGFFSCIREIARFGAPAFLAQLGSPVGMGIITRLLATEGPDTVAAFTVATRIETLTLVPFFALQSGIGPFIGQNVGAGKPQRLLRARRSILLFAAGWGLAGAFIIGAFGGDIASWFTQEDDIRHLTDDLLEAMALGLWGAGLMVAAVGVLNPLGYPSVGMGVAALRHLGLFAGGSVLLVALAVTSPLGAVFIMAPLSYVIAGCIGFALTAQRLRHVSPATAPA